LLRYLIIASKVYGSASVAFCFAKTAIAAAIAAGADVRKVPGAGGANGSFGVLFFGKPLACCGGPTAGPGGAPSVPGVLTVVHNYTQAEFATLMIQIAGMSPDQFSVLNVLGNDNLNGFLDPVLLNGFVPTIGDSFTFLNYASLTGEFSTLGTEFSTTACCSGQSSAKPTMRS
jgi:hypothetical protein